MFFTVIERWSDVPPNSRDAAFLLVDNWDDWFSYRTMFSLWIFDEQAVRHQVGSVKIGQRGLRPSGAGVQPGPGLRAPEVPRTFDSLDDRFFSVGQDENYYETLNGLTEIQRQKVLIGLRDCAFDLTIFEAAIDERVMQTSLLRSVSADSVRGRLHRLSIGDATLTEFKFNYQFPEQGGDIVPPVIRFEVTPDSQPLTNVHVLIGRNGVGKTRCMRGMAEALLGREPDREDEPIEGEYDDRTVGRVVIDEGDPWSFSGLVMISFSAFDDFDLRPRPNDLIRSHQVGLLQWETEDDEEHEYMKTPTELAEDFRESFTSCRDGLRAARWRAAVETLEADDLFAEANVAALLEMDDEAWVEAALRLYRRLSSGHAIVLLTMTRLVELVDERTLVLLDEPESHLHPPLLSAFIRALSDLLVNRNGVAVIATHSPVVLQEVPRACAWKLRRSGLVAVVERPTVETFGENVGILTREVFGFEVTKSGFHGLLDQAVNQYFLNYEQVVELFGGQLGAEAHAIVQALVAERDEEE
jgi:AAA domain, putative AbiEii toxin, Type IV TA system